MTHIQSWTRLSSLSEDFAVAPPQTFRWLQVVVSTVMKLMLFCAAFGPASQAGAQIRIGQTIDLTGPTAPSVQELLAGAQLVFDDVNAKGGIKGQKLEIVQLDDGFDTKKTAENAHLLLQDPSVLGLFMTRGTPNTLAVIPVLNAARASLIAPSTGSVILQSPVQKHVFNVRASYQSEVIAVLDHLHMIGVSRVAVIHADDSFGEDVLDGAKKSFTKNGIKPVDTIAIDRVKPDYESMLKRLEKAAPQAVLWAGASAVVAKGAHIVRERGLPIQLITLSNNASKGFLDLLGPAAGGVIVTQVFPSEDSTEFPFIKQARLLAQTRGGAVLSPAMLEGYAGAKVLVEALTRASPNPSREKLQKALESMGNYDLGGLWVRYNREEHLGVEHTHLSIVAGNHFSH